MPLRLLLPCALLGLSAWAADLAAPQFEAGAWRQTGTPAVLCQSDPDSKSAVAWLLPAGTGPCWRIVVEPGTYPGRTGMRWGADATGKGGCCVALAGSESGELLLLGADGQTLWQDQGVGWLAYSPVWIEGISDARGVRAQMLAADGQTVLAQSPWLPAAPAPPAPQSERMGVFTAGNTARFCFPQRSDQPLAEYSENNPSLLRVPRAGDDRWVVVGEGAWRWKDHDLKMLLQTRPVERTTAFMTAAAPAEGTWRCRVRLERETCGGGMLVQADKTLQTGFLAWLGGTYGDGGLMVYRYPMTCLWAGPQGVWKWDTEYALEMTLRNSTVQARLLAADGTTVLAESPALPITAEEAQRTGMTGFQTWRGTGQFSDFAGAEAPPAPPATTTPAADLGQGWRVLNGLWEWQDAQRQTLCRRDSAGVGAVIGAAIKGARGTFRCQAKTTGATAVALLFQLSPDGREGFEARFGDDGLALRTLSGETLWRGGEARCSGSGEYTLEGIVSTDRVRIRLLDAAGKLLTESVDRYVSATNNTRTGALGLRCEAGPAEFRDWSWTAE